MLTSWIYMLLGHCRGGVEMQLCDHSYNWVILLMVNAISTVLFSVLQKLLMFPKIEILRKFWAILCPPFNSSVTKILLRNPNSKQSVIRELRNVPLNSTASKYSSDIFTFCWCIVVDWRLVAHYACNIFFYFQCWGFLYILRKNEGECRVRNCRVFISDLKTSSQSRFWATDFRLRLPLLL